MKKIAYSFILFAALPLLGQAPSKPSSGPTIVPHDANTLEINSGSVGITGGSSVGGPLVKGGTNAGGSMTVGDIGMYSQDDKLILTCTNDFDKCHLAEGRTLDDVVAYILWRQQQYDDFFYDTHHIVDVCLKALDKQTEEVKKVTKALDALEPATPPKKKEQAK